MGYQGFQDTAMVQVPLALPSAYGYVLLSAFVSVCALIFLAECVGQARRRYKVDYPLLYASHYVVRAAGCKAPGLRARTNACAARCACAARRLTRAAAQTEGRFLKEDEAAAAKMFNCYQVRNAARCGSSSRVPCKRLRPRGPTAAPARAP